MLFDRACKLLQAIAKQIDIRGLRHKFGRKLGLIDKTNFEELIRVLVEGLADFATL